MFQIAFHSVLTTLLYILPGFIVAKMKKVAPTHLPGLSGLLVYACSPCLVFSTLQELDFSFQNLGNMFYAFLLTLFLQGAFMAILYLVLRSRYHDAKYRILTVGSAIGNVGFFGLPIIRAILPDHPEVSSYAVMFMMSMNIYVFTMVIFCLTENVRYMTLRQAVVNPSSLAFIVGIVFFCLKPLFAPPALFLSACTTIGGLTTPLCMLILGIRLANMDFKRLFTNAFVYLVAGGKLLLFPLFCFLVLHLLPVPETMRMTLFILSGTPCAAVLLSMAEMVDAEQELAANCLLVSTLLCCFTIPLLALCI